jgi:hypothetical protein
MDERELAVPEGRASRLTTGIKGIPSDIREGTRPTGAGSGR